jgi:hypothetical protein
MSKLRTKINIWRTIARLDACLESACRGTRSHLAVDRSNLTVRRLGATGCMPAEVGVRA